MFEDESNLKRIAERAFARSRLKSIRIPKSVEFLGSNCFNISESLVEVIFTGNPRVAPGAFDNCPLKSVKVPVGMQVDYSFPEDCKIEFLSAE
jgi:hypothetical protein